MRFCDVCMYYCDAVTIMKAWITKWASCTHGSTQEKSRDFAKKSMYAKRTARLTRCHVTACGEICVNVARILSWFPAQQAPGLDFWPTFSWQGWQRPCKTESKMAHWRSPRTILLVKIFFIVRFSLFLPFSTEMFLVMEIVFSEFKKQNNFDELKSKSSMEYFQNLPIASLKNQVQQQKKEEEDQFTKRVWARSVRLLRVSGKLQAIARKTAKNVLGDLACWLMKTALCLSLIPGGRDNLNIEKVT